MNPPPEETAPKAEAVLIVQERPSKLGLWLVPPLVLMVAAAALIVWRVRTPDWHWPGGPSPDSRAETMPPSPEPPALALNDTLDAPGAPAEAKPESDVAPEAAEVPVKPAEDDARSDIAAEADRIRAEREELDRVKKEEGERLERERQQRQAQQGPFGGFAMPPGFAFGAGGAFGRGGAGAPADFQALHRQMEQQRREMDAMMDRMRSFHEEMLAQHRARVDGLGGPRPVFPRPGESAAHFQARLLREMQQQVEEMDAEMRRHFENNPPAFGMEPSHLPGRGRRTVRVTPDGRTVTWNFQWDSRDEE
jgi:hypothetical protein